MKGLPIAQRGKSKGIEKREVYGVESEGGIGESGITWLVYSEIRL